MFKTIQKATVLDENNESAVIKLSAFRSANPSIAIQYRVTLNKVLISTHLELSSALDSYNKTVADLDARACK